MKKLITFLGIVSLAACDTDNVLPEDKKFVPPTESVALKEIFTLPYEGNGIKIELVEDESDSYSPLFGNLYFLNKQKIFSGYWSGLYKTSNEGKDWGLKFMAPFNIYHIEFIKDNSNIGFAVGGRTTRRMPCMSCLPFHFSPANININGFVARTTNEGESWEVIYNKLDTGIQSIYPLGSKPGVLIAAGVQRNWLGSIIRSEDYGNTWNTVYEGNGGGKIIALTDQYLFTSGGLVSKDYGMSWAEVSNESIRYLQGIYTGHESGAKISGIGYRMDDYANSDWSTARVFQERFDAETLELIDSKTVYKSELPAGEYRLNRAALIQQNGKPLFTGNAYTPQESGDVYEGILLVYPDDSKWHPLKLKVSALKYVQKVDCYDGECYLVVTGACWNDGCPYYLLKLTFQ